MSEATTDTLGISDDDNGSTPGKWFHFILADEWDPTRGKLVRKVVYPQRLRNSQALLEQILRPERHGFIPRSPGSPASLGRHVLGMTESRFISTSRGPFGSPRFEGRRYWIDEARLRHRARPSTMPPISLPTWTASRPGARNALCSSSISRTSSARAW